MEDDNKFGYFFLGLGLGVAAGLLFAPKSGPETREYLLTKADEGKDYLRRRGEDLKSSADDLVQRGKASASDLVEKGKQSANDLIDRGKTAATQQRDQIAAAVEAGKQAYRTAVGSTPGTEGV